MRRIPRAFQMGPHRVTVHVVDAEEMQRIAEREDCADGNPCGLCIYDSLTIYVQKASRKFPKSMQMHAFWHEYFHMALHLASRPRLCGDEVLVDTLGALQLQAFNTAEF